MVRESWRILEGCAPDQSDNVLGRGIQRGEMPCVFAPSPGDHRHRMPLKGEPCFTLRRVRGQRVLEAAEGLALLQCLPESTGQAGVAALLGEALHDLEGLR
jgi:hypothetical protein